MKKAGTTSPENSLLLAHHTAFLAFDRGCWQLRHRTVAFLVTEEVHDGYGVITLTV